MERVRFAAVDQIEDGRIYYVTAVARFQGKWVFARHHQRSSWDMPGGRREEGETSLEAMKRELWEETGAWKAEIHEICAYLVDENEKCGMLYFADIQELGPLPQEFEMAELQLLDTLPEQQTYPHIYPALFLKIQGWLNTRSGAGELWDVYDKNRNPTGRLHRRGEPLAQGEYHLVVHVWMQNSEGKFLLTKRSPNKGFPNMWETTGGSALAGDDSLAAALREVREETGLTLDPSRGAMVLSMVMEDYIRDVWLFRQNFDLTDVRLQLGETTDKMYADQEKILTLYRQGKFVPYGYLEELFEVAGH